MMKFIFGVVFSFLWASIFIAGKYALIQLPPMDVLSLRFLVGGVLIAIISLIVNKGRFDVWRDKSLWQQGLVLACLNFTMYLGFSYIGLQTVSPELVVLIVSTMPFVTTFALSIIQRQWLWLQWLAISIGFIGVYVVLSARMPTATLSIGVIWTVLGMLSLAVGTLFYQFYAHRHDVLALTGVQNLLAGLVLLPLSHPSLWTVAMTDMVFVLSMAYQIIIGSVIATIMWFVLVRWFGSANASAFHLLNPIFAAILAWWFFGVQLGITDMAGTLMVMGALGLLHKSCLDNEKITTNDLKVKNELQ